MASKQVQTTQESSRFRLKEREPTNLLTAGRRRLFWPFIIPALLFYAAFLFAPLVYSGWLSFYRWRGFGDPEWVGLDNYTRLLEDDTFGIAFRNTLIITVGVGALVFFFSFALTLVLREMAGRRFARAALFAPNIIAPLVLAILWGFLLRSDGLVNSALGALGITGTSWLSENLLFWMICLALVWIHTGFFIIIFMAGVDNIPAYYYEDALLSGANAFQRFRHITLPLSWEVIAVASLLWTVNSVKIFEFIYALGAPSGYLPPPSSWNSALFVYAQTFGGRIAVYEFGYASAAAIVSLVLIALIVLLLRRLMRRTTVEM